jgi:hypothetical protein
MLLKILGLLFGIAVLVGILSVAISAIRYLWDHPLFSQIILR